MELRKLANKYRKESLYDNYYYLTKEPEEYDKITKYKMVLSVYEMFNESPSLILEICTTEELLLLKKLLKKPIPITHPSDEIFTSLHNKFLLLLDFTSGLNEIPSEVEQAIKQALNNFDEVKSREKDELNYLLVGIIRTYFILTLDEMFGVFSEYHALSYVNLKNHLKESLYLRRFIDSNNENVYISEEYLDYLDWVLDTLDNRENDFNHLYKKSELVSVGKHRVNLEDSDIKKLYQLIERNTEQFAQNLLLNQFKTLTALSMPDGFHEFLNYLHRFSNEKIEMNNKTLQIVMNAWNKMPNWTMKGVAPHYAAKASKEELESKPNELQVKLPAKYGRNEPCPCGSDKKYKKCCLNQKQIIKNEARLSTEDAKVFYKLFLYLCAFTNKKYHIIDGLETYQDFYTKKGTIIADYTIQIREKIWEDKSIIKEFLKSDMNDLNDEEQTIIKSWERRITNKFVLYKYVDGKAILLDEHNGYVVSGIYNPISENIPATELPMFVETTLLPFKDVIVYDTFLNNFNITLGDGIKQELDLQYEKNKANTISKL